MAANYRPSINNRNLEILNDSKDITIFKWTRDSYTNELGEALDGLYLERFLNDGHCTVCNAKTTKFCINCFTHYCSNICQSTDWPKHRVVCKNSNLSTQFHSHESFDIIKSFTDSKGSESKCQWIARGRIDGMRENGECMNDERFDQRGENVWSCKETENKSMTSLEILENNNKKNSCNGDENNVNLNDELNVISKYGKIRYEGENKKEKSEGIIDMEQRIGCNGLYENKGANMNTHKSLSLQNKKKKTEIKYYDNSFSVGDIIEVLIMKNSQDKNGNQWVLQEKNLKALHTVEKLLLEDLGLFSQVNLNSSEIVQMIHDGEPVRARLISSEPKLLVQCIDTGAIFVPRTLRYKYLPDYLKSIKGLAFPINCEKLNLPESDSPNKMTIQVLDVFPNGVFKVKILKANNVLNISRELDDAKEPNAEVIPDESNNNKNLRRSIFDELEVGDFGIFTSSDIDNEEIFGCLVPDSADYCKKKIMSLYCMEANRIDAEIGDLVLVPNKENLGQRGIVKTKSEIYGYEVRLIDYGHLVKSCKIYKVPEKVTHITELGCRFNRVNVSDSENFEINKHYFFEIKERIDDCKWLCSLKTDLSSSRVFSEGYIDKPEDFSTPQMKLIPFESGCVVSISATDNDSDENAFYVQRVDEDWEERLHELSLKINSFSKPPSEYFFNSLRVGDLVASKYSKDGVFYRAKVISKSGNTASVFYVDFGNKEIARNTDLRPLPSSLKELPAFALRVKLSGSDCSSVDANFAYLQKLMNDNQDLIMTYDGDASDGVTLDIKGSVNVNKEVFAQIEESTQEETVMPGCLMEKFLEYSCFREGPAKGFVLLNLDDKEFTEKGLFWASDLYSDDFKDIVLNCDISNHCETDKEKYFPAVGELCFASYEDGWYRGLVLEQTGVNFKIFFIDFGNSCHIPYESIRKMVPKFFETPPAAVRCFLTGFDKIPKEKIKSICFGLKDKINETLSGVTIEKVDKNSCYVRIPEIF